MKLSESGGEAEKKKHTRDRHFEHELKNMIRSLNRKGAEKAGPSQYEQEGKEEEEDGIRVITISGSNIGATMKTELDNNHGDRKGEHELEFLSTYYVNSNFQAVNNSIMIGANYETHDPGVHLEISDDVEEKPSMKVPARGSRGKKEKTSVRSYRRESEHTE
ncbi:hypothetical protein AALP_AA2G004700 [Arabis alpina]|uniref:Uncharacterized protein n=1 Tax=Arabis alpina TaxID=50452 RepID=A0A087HEF4_ARAAL|nr:hypothetical protein AALP_AA2G004700 [Arabis alpina]